MKIKMRCATVSLLCICGTAFVQAQSISGVVNIYTAVSNISGTDITVGSTAGFAAGDRVLVIQMKGATIDETNTSAFGDILSYGSAGYYEFADVASVSGSDIILENPLCRTYDVSSAVQMVRVPVYGDVTISGIVTADPWDGSTGGVVAIEASGTITFNADINVDGQGFRGGDHCTSYFSCGVADYYSNYAGALSCVGGKKGEGIAIVDDAHEGSRGKAASGGGGSNSGQHGAGGGSNFGMGGRSGYEWTGCTPYDDIWALGGEALDYASVDRVFMGGGGGGGHQDNGLSVTDGTKGGGIVLLNAGTIDGMGNAISANGEDVTYITDSEGAGAGGAGGSVILRVGSVSSDLMVYVEGGDGGSINSTLWAGTCHGPGGGGGGGYLGTSMASIPVTITLFDAGGDPGIITSPGAFCDGTPHGAEAGDSGGVMLNLPIVFTYPVVDLGNDTSVCAGDDLYTLDPGPGYASYLWQDGSTNETMDVNTPGTYWVIVTNASGCTASDTVNILSIAAAPPLNFPDSIQFCQGSNVNLNAGSGYSSYLWSDGSTGQTFSIDTTGIFWCTVTNASGCATTDSILVPSLWPKPFVDLGPDTTICLGEEVMLDATQSNSTYLWQDGSTLPTYLIQMPGVYSVKVTNEYDCSSEDEMTAFEGCGDDVYIPNAFSPNGDGLNDVYEIQEYRPLVSFDMKIYDRWGQMVFEGNDIFSGWDGTYQGKPEEIGTYVCVIEYQKQTFDGVKTFTRSVTVTLLR